MPAFARLLAVLLIALAGCTANPAQPPLTADTYELQMSGVPTAALSPGETFNVSVNSSMGMGMGMHRMASDHMGAHFWNHTAMDPTADLANATTCVHQVGNMPGSFMAQCTAPMAAGTYHIRAHARINDNGTMHHWWGESQTFTVA